VFTAGGVFVEVEVLTAVGVFVGVDALIPAADRFLKVAVLATVAVGVVVRVGVEVLTAVGTGVLVGIKIFVCGTLVGGTFVGGTSVGGTTTGGASVGGSSTGGSVGGGASTTGASVGGTSTTGGSVASPAAPDNCPGAHEAMKSDRMMISEMTFKTLKCVFDCIRPLLSSLIVAVVPKKQHDNSYIYKNVP
jgi:hypothetical protein